MKSELTEKTLKERVKELTCLLEISSTIAQADRAEKKILQKIILSVKKAYMYSEDIVIEVQIQDFILSTSKLPKHSVFQISDITILEANSGFIKAHYPKNKYNNSHFLDEEQKLLNAIAFEIGSYLEKFQILEKKNQLISTIEHMNRLSILSEMTAGIAHELNNPLANILGYAELIKLNNTDPEIDVDISTIINSAIYSRKIINKILSFSSDVPYHFEKQKIKSMVNFAVSLLKQNFQRKEIKNELIFKNTIDYINVDSIQLTQALLNLLINALDASPEKSTLKTTIENDLQYLFVIIEDQGLGIHENIKSKVFEPFFTTKAANEGCGIGLTMVSRIVKIHNGEIIIKDNFPQGTIFTIKLPLTQ
ncbi:hypothetical protein B0A75_20245 [Flavobacterium oncorhynchi]|uniref:histidine kinase n=1 Tax=Flavobacterium oncorhynchi TaxID=728056 RepID=A0A226HGG3_9FLAO|nr:HAMP domain-containing sensor histidine kinase [Flavobacterium oncorhynchi]OXA93275.1 hypothetical protein B0A75_20245 [Flavobacterium oncorhynchi]